MKIFKVIILFIFILISSCVSKKKYLDIENRVQLAQENEQLCKNDLKTQQNENLILNTKLINEVNKVNANKIWSRTGKNDCWWPI